MPSVKRVTQQAAAMAGRAVRGRVAEILDTGHILVELAAQRRRRVLCEFLETSDSPGLVLAAGDAVLVLPPAEGEETGIVLGRIGRYRAPDRRTVTLEAQSELVLRCGESALTLRRDGKVLTRAVDVASIAKRRNRIKGGSVEIN